jgi:hypothetical protein
VTPLNTIFQRSGLAYRDQYGASLTAHQRRVMVTIESCRTEALGGQIFTCPDCQTVRYSYHSCRNRHCPTCQQDAGAAWLADQQALLLPVPYFLVTFTVPAELRPVARTQQAQVYAAMFRASAAALQQLAGDARFLGGQLGMLGVLQTWTRDLRYHPHIHYLVPAVGRTATGQLVFPPAVDFLLPVRPLAVLFRAKLRAALRQTPHYVTIPDAAWTHDWVIDCRPVGTGETALKYLAPYIFRVALSNNRILSADAAQVTFRYRHSDSGENRTSTLPVDTFIDRFIAHILPKGFVKVRYYGLFRPGVRADLRRIRAQLQLLRGQALRDPEIPQPDSPSPAEHLATCPTCGARMQGRRLAPSVARAPPHGVNTPGLSGTA